MVRINRRRLPAGIQSFKEIRRKNCLYVDKTDIVWELVNEGDKFNYMSRPCRSAGCHHQNSLPKDRYAGRRSYRRV